MIKTPLCAQLGVEHPIMLAGMGGVSYAEVVAAVSNAGGFGTLGMAGTSAKFIEGQMQRVRELTDKPFGVDLLSAQPESLTSAIEVIIANGAKAFVAGLGVPYPIVKQLKDAGVLVFAVIGKVDHAIKAEQAGCDGVIAQGTEGGGHTGSVASVALWPQAVFMMDGALPPRSPWAAMVSGWARGSSPRRKRMPDRPTRTRSWKCRNPIPPSRAGSPARRFGH